MYGYDFIACRLRQCKFGGTRVPDAERFGNEIIGDA